MIKRKPIKAQEEILGFALIIIIVSVILLVFLGISIRKPVKETIESYEVESFIQSFLQYTTDCKDNLGHRSVQQLIFDCYEHKKCSDEREACEVLKSDLNEIVTKSWKLENRPVTGYLLEISANDETIITLNNGNNTKNYKGGIQDFSKSGNLIEISFKAFY